jgi:hypothetical protein
MREGRDIWRCDLASNWDRNLRSVRHAARSQLIKIGKRRATLNSRAQEWLIVIALHILHLTCFLGSFRHVCPSALSQPDFDQTKCGGRQTASTPAYWGPALESRPGYVLLFRMLRFLISSQQRERSWLSSGTSRHAVCQTFIDVLEALPACIIRAITLTMVTINISETLVSTRIYGATLQKIATRIDMFLGFLSHTGKIVVA